MSDRKISEAVRALAGTQFSDPVEYVPATVTAVDISTRTCTCLAIAGTTEIELIGVHLMAEVEDGFMIIPKINSTVLVTYSKRNYPAIILFSAIDEILIVTGDSTINMKDGVTKFNDGSFGGLVKVSELVGKLNNVENLLNDLIAKFNNHTHILTLTSGTGTAAITATPETQTLTPTQNSDIENTKVTHGE